MKKREIHINDSDNQEFGHQETVRENSGVPEDDGEMNVNLSGEETPAADTVADMSQTDWKDKYMRLSAEFDNYRKRTLKEKMDLVSYGGEDVIKMLLPVLDDIDRALHAIGNSDDIESARTGIELISGKFRDTLKNKGLSEIHCIGEPLDTDLHEAVAKIPAENESKGKIVDVVQKGYKLGDKVVRHSKVVMGE